MQNLLTWRFWFNLRPEAMLPLFTNVFLAFLLVLLLAAIFTALKQRHKSLYKNFWKRSYSFSLGNLLIGIILFFFNYERAAFLSARFWLAIWVMVMLAWLVPIIKSYRRIPLQKKKIEQEQEFKKYIP